jgi:GT2 family glycosyltransferase
VSVRVEVVIPHMSRWPLLERLLASLRAQSVVPAICVVDNASTDESLARLSAQPDIRVVPSAVNLGFGRAVNLGVRTSLATTIVLLNNDMVAEPQFIERVLTVAEARGGQAAGALQLQSDGTIDTLGVMVDTALTAYDVGHGKSPREAATLAPLAIGPSGGACAFPRDRFLAVGGYDERIFAYLEDVDLALRLHAAGVRFAVAVNARVWHRHSATLGSGSSAKNELMGWSRGYVLWKYRAALSRRARLRGYVTDAIVYAGQVFIDGNGAALRGRLRAAVATGRQTAPECPRDLPTMPIKLHDSLARRRARRT